MADNVPVTAGTGTDIATDDVGGAHYQRVKVDLGSDGNSSPLVRGAQTAANSLPVTTATNDPLITILGGATGTSLNAAGATGAGTAIGGGSNVLVNHTMRVTQTSCDTLVVALQGLLNDWVTLANWNLTERTSGDILVVSAACLQVRANITTITGGGAAATAYITTR